MRGEERREAGVEMGLASTCEQFAHLQDEKKATKRAKSVLKRVANKWRNGSLVIALENWRFQFDSEM